MRRVNRFVRNSATQLPSRLKPAAGPARVWYYARVFKESILWKLTIVGLMTLLPGGLTLDQMKANLPSAIPLNHFYIIIDSATYKAIGQSAFLRNEFAPTEERTTTRTDMTYTGLYFYGTNTYFEFFDVANQAIGKLGDSAIAMGADQLGVMQAIRADLSSELLVGEAPITRPFAGKQVPWFYMAVPKSFPTDSGLRFWIMEYHPRFLSEWNAQSNSSNQGVSRKQILERYAAVLKESPPRPYLKDVVGLSLAVGESTRKRMVEIGELLRYRQRVEGTTTVLEGPDIELCLVPQTAEVRGVQQITMRVDRKPEKETEFRFGPKSVLRFDKQGLATWSF
jgi:hypothetical protein